MLAPVAAGATQGPELVVDGAFETDGWTSTTGFASNNNNLWCNPAGGYFQQTIATEGGAEHTLSLDWNVYGYFGGGTSYLQVTVFDGVAGPAAFQTTLNASTGRGQFAFATPRSETFTFTPNEDTVVLRLAGTKAINDGCNSFRWPVTTGVDNVSMTYEDTPPDVAAPDVSITAPVDAGEYVLGAIEPAGFTCTDDASGVAACDGPVADGSPFDTSTLGTHTFTVDAEDNAGNLASLTHTYTVVANTPPNKDACKQGGWQGYTDDEGTPFRNQGGCVSFAVHQG